MSARKGTKRPQAPRRAKTAAARPPEPAPTLYEELAANRRETARLVGEVRQWAERTEQLVYSLSAAEEATRRMVRDLAVVFDSFERLEEFADGSDFASYHASTRTIAARLASMLALHRIELIGQRGEMADERTHRVIELEHRPDEPEGRVLAVLSHGIRFDGLVEKPAAVIVSTRTAQPDQAQQAGLEGT